MLATSLHSIFFQEGENPGVSFLPPTDEQWLKQWNEQFKWQQPALVLIISPNV